MLLTQCRDALRPFVSGRVDPGRDGNEIARFSGARARPVRHYGRAATRVCLTGFRTVQRAAVRRAPGARQPTKKRSAVAQSATDRLGRVVGTLKDQHGGNPAGAKGKETERNYPLHSRPQPDLIFLKLRAFAQLHMPAPAAYQSREIRACGPCPGNATSALASVQHPPGDRVELGQL